MLISGAEIAGYRPVDLRCTGERIVEIGVALQRRAGETRLDAGGGALLPGLHDHHIHLYALAAAQLSVDCGPPQVTSPGALARALQGRALQLQQRHARLHQEPPGTTGWIRGTGYHDSVAGALDRWHLDRMVAERPVRVQHRSGKLWMLNSAACALLNLDRPRAHPLVESGIERDDSGRATGRLFRLDDWLRDQLGNRDVPDLSHTSLQLAGMGVTGVTDATPTNSATLLALLTTAVQSGQLLQRVLLMGDEQLPEPGHRLLTRGPLKILLDDYRLPAFDGLCERIARTHCQDRSVAIHCVTPTELVFALSALIETGSMPGDRIEHASVTPDAALALLRDAAVTVVTQPGLVRERGDQYLAEVERREQPWLYRCRSLVDSGIPLGGSTDAPYGSADPWSAMAAAVQRRTRSGQNIGSTEQLSPERALALFTSSATAPGGPPRRLAPGMLADLCLLDRPWADARARLTAGDVAATIRGGEVIYRRGAATAHAPD